MISALRAALFSLVCLSGLAAGISPSSAADYPNRPVRIIVCLIQLLSYDMARKLSRGLAWLAYKVDKRHRQAAPSVTAEFFPTSRPLLGRGKHHVVPLVRSLCASHFRSTWFRSRSLIVWTPRAEAM